MIDARLGVNGVPDDFICGGDGEELLSNTFSIIGSIYAGLIRNCEHCAQLYRDVLTDPECLEDIFDTVLEEYINSEAEDFEEYKDCDAEIREEITREFEESLAMASKHRRDGFNGGKGLYGTAHIRRIK